MTHFFSPPAEAFSKQLTLQFVNTNGDVAAVGGWQVSLSGATPPRGGGALAHGFPPPASGPTLRMAAMSFPAGSARFLVVVRTSGDQSVFDVAIHDSAPAAGGGHAVARRRLATQVHADKPADLRVAPNSDGSLLLVWRVWPANNSDLHAVLRTDTAGLLALSAGMVASPGVRGGFVDAATRKVGLGLAHAAPAGRADFAFVMDEQPLPLGAVGFDTSWPVVVSPFATVGTVLRLMNTGNDPVSLTATALNSGSPFGIIKGNVQAPVDLEPGGFHDLTVGLGSAPASNQQSLRLQYVDARGPQDTSLTLKWVNDQGHGAIQTVPPSLVFGAHAQSFTVANNGTGPVTVSIKASSGATPFGWATVATTLQSGASVAVPVTFAPAGAAPATDEVNVGFIRADGTGGGTAVMLVGNPPPKPQLGDLRCGIVDFNPPGSDKQDEVVTIANATGGLLDLSRCQMHDRGSKHRLDFGTGTPADTYVGASFQVFTRVPSATDPKPPAAFYFRSTFSAVWNNTGDTVYVVDEFGVELIRHTYPEPAIPVIPPPAPQLVEERIVVVESSLDWQDTGMRFRDGDLITFEEWSNFVPNPNRKTANDPQFVLDQNGHVSTIVCGFLYAGHDADGDPGSDAPDGDTAWPLPGAAKFALVGRIAPDIGSGLPDPRFLVGTKRNLDPDSSRDYPTALASGRLELRVNDNMVSDNQGTFKVHILRFQT